MRLLLTGLLILFAWVTNARIANDSIWVFQGYLFSEDSVPVENAHLINYRDTRIVTTDSTGHFSVFVRKGDSLMINHLSLQPRVIHAKQAKAVQNHFYISYRTYQIQTVATKSYDQDYYNFEQNIKKIYDDLERLGLRNPNTIPRRSAENPYNPDKSNPGLTTTVGDVLRLFKKK